MKKVPDEIKKWLKENGYLEIRGEHYFWDDFPQDKKPDSIHIPITDSVWKTIKERND